MKQPFFKKIFLEPYFIYKIDLFLFLFRYGFIHDKRLPRKDDPNEAKSKQVSIHNNYVYFYIK